jgi:hypothetical protein
MAEEIENVNPERRAKYKAEMEARRAKVAADTERDPEKLKQWYELIGEKAEDPDAALSESARIIKSEEKLKAPKPKGFRGGAIDEAIDLEEGKTEGGRTNVSSNRNLVPLTPLGLAAHRQIYAVAEANHQAKMAGRESATPEEVEQYGKEWDSLPKAEQWQWQQTPHGKKATKEAIAAAPARVSTERAISTVRTQRTRDKVSTLALGSQEAVDRFKSTGELLDENQEQERDWRKPFALANATSQLASTKTGFQREGIALHTDPQHHQALSDHIDELMRRPSASASSNLQGGQFNVKEGLANAAKESLARSAMAHALGMKDLAISHFRQAVTHAGNLAEAVHDRNSQPIDDWDKQDGIQSKYIKSVSGGK